MTYVRWEVSVSFKCGRNHLETNQGLEFVGEEIFEYHFNVIHLLFHLVPYLPTPSPYLWSISFCSSRFRSSSCCCSRFLCCSGGKWLKSSVTTVCKVEEG